MESEPVQQDSVEQNKTNSDQNAVVNQTAIENTDEKL